MTIVEQLRKERKSKKKNGLYRQMQVLMSYHSNKMEGSTCTLEETQLLFDTSSYGAQEHNNDAIETFNHFRAFDMVLDTYKQRLSEEYIKGLHGILKFSTADRNKGYMIGEYKKIPNRVGLIATSRPENVKRDISELLDSYKGIQGKTLQDILNFHVKFEQIHPFQDGNGRIGRLIILKECFLYKIPPFIISSENNLSYKSCLFACQSKMEDADRKFVEFAKKEQQSFKNLVQTVLSQGEGK